MNPSKVREKWIDNAKGIAIILVIIGHVSGGFTGIWNFKFVYGIHLFMFFLLSGYTLKKKPLNKRYLNKKFKRLMVPYFWTCLALSVTNIWNSWFLGKDASVSTVTKIIGKDILISFFASGTYTNFGEVELGAMIGAIWFLPALFFALLIMELLLNFNENDFFLGASTGTIALIAFITAKFIWFPFSLQAGMFASFFLWIGYEIKKHHVLEYVRWYHYIFAQIVFLLGIRFGYCYIGFVTADIVDPWISIPVGLAGCMLIYLLARVDKGVVLAYIGRISLTVLCVHLYALNTLGAYFGKILDFFSLQNNSRVWANIAINVAFAVLVAVVIEKFKTFFKPVHDLLQRRKEDCPTYGKTAPMYAELGICMLMILLGYFPMDSRLRTILYSCDIAFLIFFAGYLFEGDTSFKSTIKKASKTYLLPYGITAAVILFLNYKKWSWPYLGKKIVQYIAGFSQTKRIFMGFSSVGPIYIFLVLFECTMMYFLITKLIHNELPQWLTVVLISCFGMMMGLHGFWLPWSFDIACYAMIFYHCGQICNRKRIFDSVNAIYAAYFIFSVIWAYMIYCGGMELAPRNYGQYGMVIMGAMAGMLVIYQLASYILKNLPILNKMLYIIGKSAIVIISIYTLLHKQIEKLVSFYFSTSGFAYCVLAIILETFIGASIYILMSKLSRRVQLKGIRKS